MERLAAIAVIVVTCLVGSHLVMAVMPDEELCKHEMTPAPIQVPKPSFPQDFTAVVEVNDVLNPKSSRQEVKGNTIMLKAVRGLKKGAIEVVETGFQLTALYDFGRNQMIIIEQDKDDYTCEVKPLAEGSDWIIDSQSSGDHVPPVGTPEWLFRYDPDEKIEEYLGTDTIRGVPVNHWRVCSNTGKETVITHHYWSDPDKWTPLIGNNISNPSVPNVVPVAIEASVKKGSAVSAQIFSFFIYTLDPALQREFDIPDNIYCPGLSSEDVKLPKFRKYFSFDSEVIFKDPLGDVITNQQHWYDSSLNFSRLDFSLAMDDFGTANYIDKITYIEDFERMISFLIDRSKGNCSIQRITKDSGFVKPINGGKLVIADPYTALHQGVDMQKLVYYKQSSDRGISAQVFKAQADRGSETTVQEWWFTTFFETVEETVEESRVPMKIIEYSEKDALQGRAEWNIFNFDYMEPDIFVFDVSSCFYDDDRRHFKFSLNRDYAELNPSNERVLRYLIFADIIVMTKLPPLRISDIMLDGYHNETIVIFTILGKPKVEEAIDELSTDFAVKDFETFLDAGLFLIPYFDTQGTKVELKGVPQSLEEVDRFGEGEQCWKQRVPECQHDTTSGYSAASMGGLAIGMLVLGIVMGALGGLVYFIKFKP